MKIVHVCLACYYFEAMGYQENLLPLTQASLGSDVYIISSWPRRNSMSNCYLKDSVDDSYINKNGLRVKFIHEKDLRIGAYNGLYTTLEEISPNIIFVHGGQFVSLKDVIRYRKNYPTVKLYIDQHGDYYNMPLNTFKRRVLQKTIYGHYLRKAIKYCNKFWGVTPWRCQYLHEVYKIPENKIGLLVMGGDDNCIHLDKKEKIRQEIRKGLNLFPDDFVIITGGKIDKAKNIHLLMKAVKELNIENLKLIVFGKPGDDVKPAFEELAKDPHIRSIGWLDSTKVYDYFLASDLAVFPGTHSVLWEQGASCGVPLLVKDWPGMHHVDLGGNCTFLEEDSVDELKRHIEQIYNDKDVYERMLKVAVEKGVPTFSYKAIARRSIEEEE